MVATNELIIGFDVQTGTAMKFLIARELLKEIKG